jgi:hypothetical protein
MDNLTFKNLATISAPVTLLFGLVFLLMPEQALESYDVTGANMGELQSMTQLFGTALITIGLISWSIREMEDSDIRRNLTIALTIGNSIGTIVSLIIPIEDRANALVWVSVAIYLLLALGFGYILFMKPSEVSTTEA